MTEKNSWGVVLGALGLGALMPGSVAAQQMTEVACAAPVTPIGELAPWANPIAMASASNEARSASARLAVGKAARLTLLQTRAIHYPLPPGRPGGSGSFGGLMRIDVRDAGTYRVALGSAAWIDIVRGGKAIASSAHGHGPACTGVRKMVDFPLGAGRYMLQIAASGEPQITVLVARLP